MAKTRQGDWYDEPHWYDILHVPGTRAEVAGLRRLARRFCPSASSPKSAGGRSPVWLEPACGSGRYLIEAARHGIRGVGIDVNPRMIRYAKAAAEGADVRFVKADIATFALPKRDHADLAFCLINSARHLMSDRAMIDHLRCMSRALRPGGAYVVGLSLSCYAMEMASEDVWIGTRGGTRVHQFVQYLAPEAQRRRERVVSHLTVTSRREEHHLDSTYDLRTYSGPQWANVVKRSGMECIGIVDEGGEDLPGTRSDGRKLLASGAWWTPSAAGYALFVLRPTKEVRAEVAQLRGSSRVGGGSRR